MQITVTISDTFRSTRFVSASNILAAKDATLASTRNTTRDCTATLYADYFHGTTFVHNCILQISNTIADEAKEARDISKLPVSNTCMG